MLYNYIKKQRKGEINMMNEEYVRKFIGKEIDKLFDLMEEYNLSFDDLMEYFKMKGENNE